MNVRILPAGILLFVLVACDKPRTAEKYLVPENYQGWCFMLWERPQTEDGVQSWTGKVLFDANGIAKFSIKAPTGEARNSCFYVDKDGVAIRAVPNWHSVATVEQSVSEGRLVYDLLYIGDRQAAAANPYNLRLEKLLSSGLVKPLPSPPSKKK